eukprot:TRINITY_DN8521_c0_g1_i2.p1 TRINITY_DN8521_c0_g1~~TRINITY_DN8521_c0_g1_i2.p1  ORF type:complete len:421 (+),score=88.91 TRINITY_DN8521_c0_g1_i2:84-1346(+)
MAITRLPSWCWRTLDVDSPKRQYFKTPHEDRSVNHWGQRKLLLSEIEFLTEFAPPDATDILVVYAGAAPGSHIPYLSSLFPHVSFDLWDPAPFKIESDDKLQTHQALFEISTAKEIAAKSKDKTLLFISDIRTADPRRDRAEVVESMISSDMKLQMDWVQAMKPYASMLKFRLPWIEGKTEYLNGKIYLPVWGPETTTEARLIVTDPDDVIDYDNLKYEQQMFHFNTVTRVQYYNHSIRTRELDHCYDCAAEIHVLRKYQERHHNMLGAELDREIINMASEISDHISNGRNLLTRIDVTTRKSWYANKTNRFGRPSSSGRSHERSRESRRNERSKGDSCYRSSWGHRDQRDDRDQDYYRDRHSESRRSNGSRRSSHRDRDRHGDFDLMNDEEARAKRQKRFTDEKGDPKPDENDINDQSV